MPEGSVREGSAPLSEKGRRNKRPNRRKRAKQWTFLIEKLKLAVDGLYEMCREEQNLNGCKEALMYLQNSKGDFESLIASIHVELSWEEKEKPQAVAWEIRKSMSSPIPVVTIKDPAAIINQMTPLMFSEVVKAASDRKKTVNGTVVGPPPQQPPAQSSPEEKKTEGDVDVEDSPNKDEWQVVLRGRRKKSLSSMTSDSRDDLDTLEHTDSARPSNVYERLTSSTRRYPPSGRGPAPASSFTSSNYLCPKSAMDLPQTKASMAKMAYSRQLLWQRSQSTLMEKMKARHASQRNVDFNAANGPRPRVPVEMRGGVGGTGGGGGGEGGKKNSPSDAASEANRNLLPIRETQEDEKGEIIPVDPKPSSTVASDSNETIKENDACLSTVSAPPTVRLGVTGGGDNSSSMDDGDSRLSFPLSNPELLNLETDREWREMTEEEESLAFEERSLNIEIEQAKNLSIDAELERQVAAEADALEKEEEDRLRREQEQREAEERAEEEEEERKRPEEEEEEEKVEEKKEGEEVKVDYEMFKRWQEEMAELATVSWSELVERELAASTTTHLREPGDAAMRHERMMSPSRKRGDISEEDLSRRHEEKQRRADELREKLKEEKAARLKGLLQKVEEVREKRAALIERKRLLMESRLRTAKENRERNLEEIVRKAREDEAKVKEVQLIQTLEKGNMRMDQQMREQRNENRRAEIAEERVKKHEEKAAKEAAAEGRRRMNDTRSECSVRSEIATEGEEQRAETPVKIEEEEEVKPIDLLPKKEEVKEVEIEDTVKVVEKSEKKKRKNSKEKKKGEERKKEKEEEEEGKRENGVEVVEEHPWREIISTWITGGGMLSDDRGFRCTECDVELRSEWDAVAHVLDTVGGRHHRLMDEEENGRVDGRQERLVECLSAYVKLIPKKQESERKESVSAKNKKKRAKRGETVRMKESVEGLARAVGGGNGPSVDLWRDLLTSVGETAMIGEDAIREVSLFGKRNAQRKKAGEAVAGFVEEYGRGKENDSVLSVIIDASLRVLVSDRSIRGGGGKERDEKENKELDEAVFGLLRCLVKESSETFARLFSSSHRSLRLSSVLLDRVDTLRGERHALRRTVQSAGRVGAAAAAGAGPLMTTLQPVVFELLMKLAGVGGAKEGQTVMCLLDAPRRLSTLPIAHLCQPPNRHILLSTVIALTKDNQEALQSLKLHLSPWHCVQFLKSEIDRTKCICPLHTVLPTKESITAAIQYYEKSL